MSWSSRGRSGSGGSAGNRARTRSRISCAVTACVPPAPLSASASASVTGRSRWYSSFDPDRTAFLASAAASRSSRPSPSPAAGRNGRRGPGPAVPQPLRAAPGRHQRVAGGPGLRDQVIGRAAERLRRVQQRGIGGEQHDPAVPAARADLLVSGVGPAQGLRPVQGQAQQPAPIRAAAAASAVLGRGHFGPNGVG